METKYIHYKADQLLNDDYFLQSELHSTAESREFWRAMENKHDSLAKEIQIARNILIQIKKNTESPVLPNQEEIALWERINRVNRKYDNKRIAYISLIATAAAAIALFFVLNKGVDSVENNHADYLSLIESAKGVEDKSGNIQLLLSDNKKLNLHGKESEIEYEKEGEIRINSEKVQIADEDKKPEESLNTLIVPIGKRSNVTLADGTKIWVNSDTKVIYPIQFGATKREIFVEGEIYLDVNHNEKAPFVVKTRDSQITVLGTKFNVSAYANDPRMDVVLVSGKVEVQLAGKEKSVLSPNQLISYNKSTKKSEISQVDISDYVAWKDGYYQFSKQSLDVILNKIAKYYGVKIIWDDHVGRLSCTGKLDLKDDPKDVFTLLAKAAPIEIDTNNESIHIKVKP